jgi:hypothetical protein
MVTDAPGSVHVGPIPKGTPSNVSVDTLPKPEAAVRKPVAAALEFVKGPLIDAPSSCPENVVMPACAPTVERSPTDTMALNHDDFPT